jgi:hypothetical protein
LKINTSALVFNCDLLGVGALDDDRSIINIHITIDIHSWARKFIDPHVIIIKHWQFHYLPSLKILVVII